MAQSAVYRLKTQYPTSSHFSRAYNPDLQNEALRSVSRFVSNGRAPFLRDVAETYSEDEAKAWMRVQLIPVFGLQGNVAEDMMPLLYEVTNILFARFERERVTIYMLFCAKCRAREYKIAYGTIKVDAILEAANDFLHDLPKMKERIGGETIRKNNQGKVSDSWKWVTYRDLFLAWRDSVFNLYDEGGISALRVVADDTEDAYHTAVRAMMGIEALKFNDSMSEVFWNETNFKNHISTLRDEHIYYQQREVYKL